MGKLINLNKKKQPESFETEQEQLIEFLKQQKREQRFKLFIFIFSIIGVLSTIFICLYSLALASNYFFELLVQ